MSYCEGVIQAYVELLSVSGDTGYGILLLALINEISIYNCNTEPG